MADDNDKIALLVKLGILGFVVAGVYELIKNVGSHKAGQRMTEKAILAEADRLHTEWLREEAEKAAQESSRRVNESVQRVYAYCERHGEQSEQCLADSGWHSKENRCMKCNGGVGDSSGRWCQSCQDDYDSINSDDD